MPWLISWLRHPWSDTMAVVGLFLLALAVSWGLTVWWKGRCKSGRAGFATAVIPENKKTTGCFPVP